MIRIEANIPFIEPSQWAILEHSLIDLMNGSIDPVMERYVRADGSILWPTRGDFSGIDGLDDAYESCHSWSLFYLLGGSDHILEYSHRTWEGITRQFARYDTGHNPLWSSRNTSRGTTGCAKVRGICSSIYSVWLTRPTKKLERAECYAGFYLNEDPAALNYDAEKRLIKCAHNGSMGPAYRNFEKHYTTCRYTRWKLWSLPFHDIPGIETVVDLQKPGMEEKMGQALVDERMGRDDVACNLAATSMVTNAYISSGGDKYKSSVVEYTQVWIERTRQNNGILPANLASRARSANISTASGMMVTMARPGRTVGTI